MLVLLKWLDGPWERARGYLREDLDHLEAALNQRWADTFGDSNVLNLTVSAAGILSPDHGGTGLTVYAIGDLPYASAVDTLTKLAIGANHTVLKSTGTLPAWGLLDLTTDVSGVLPIANGGTRAKGLFDHYTDIGNGTTVETDLYTDTLAAAQFATNGDKVTADYAGIFVTHATATRQLKVYVGGTAIFDSGALVIAAGADSWDVRVRLIRVSTTVLRACVSMSATGSTVNAFTTYTEVTGLTLSATNILKITGTAATVGAASNDIVAKFGSVQFAPAV